MSNHKKRNTITDNRGLSLVELIVAVALGVIVAGSIAALMTFAIRSYRNESVNTEMQYELQTNINTIMDEIMGASVFVVKQNGGVDIDVTGAPYTQYAMFGRVKKGVTLGVGGKGQRFDGVIFVSTAATSGRFKILMNRVSEEGKSLDIDDIASTSYDDIIGATDQTPYLLGENVIQFGIEPDPKRFDTTKSTYENPIEVKVRLCFQKNGWGEKEYSKRVDDNTYLRNKVTETVYINDTAYKLKKVD